MFGFLILLVAFVTATNSQRVSSPQYVQAKEAFAHAKVYVSESLTPDVQDINDVATRTHYSYGILSSILAEMVIAPLNNDTVEYQPLCILHQSLPYAWTHYYGISKKAQDLLNEVSQKVSGVSSLIDNLCGAEGVPQCNAKVHEKVLSNPNIYRQEAALLLQLGKVSEAVRNLESNLVYITENRYEIPYLVDNVETKKYQNLVQDFRDLYVLMRKMQFRRFNNRAV